MAGKTASEILDAASRALPAVVEQCLKFASRIFQFDVTPGVTPSRFSCRTVV